MTLIAHSSHWLVNAAYVMPFAVFLAWLFVTTVRERRQAGKEGRDAPDA